MTPSLRLPTGPVRAPEVRRTAPSTTTHVNADAISLFSSRTFWLNAADFVVNLLSATAIVTVIPPSWQPLSAAAIAGANIFLRTQTVRPVALIPPGAVKTVLVPKVGPPDPPLVTD